MHPKNANWGGVAHWRICKGQNHRVPSATSVLTYTRVNTPNPVVLKHVAVIGRLNCEQTIHNALPPHLLSPVSPFLIMTQSIVVQVGQCGNQIGCRFWDLALREHAMADKDSKSVQQ